MNKTNLILAISITLFVSSCATLYTTPSQPTAFLNKADGSVVQGSLAATGSTINIRAAATKPVSDQVSLHGSLSKSFMGIYNTPFNPYENKSKRDWHYDLGLGYNITKYTKYPLQLWFSLQGGRSGDSYVRLPYETTISKDVLLNTSGKDTIARYEYLYGGYVAPRIGVSSIWISNYDNNQTIRAQKRVATDVVGTISYAPMRYRYANAANFARKTNNVFSIGLSGRLIGKRTILSLNIDRNFGIKDLTDELLSKPIDDFEVWQISPSTVAFGFAYRLNSRK